MKSSRLLSPSASQSMSGLDGASDDRWTYHYDGPRLIKLTTPTTVKLTTSTKLLPL